MFCISLIPSTEGVLIKKGCAETDYCKNKPANGTDTNRKDCPSGAEYECAMCLGHICNEYTKDWS